MGRKEFGPVESIKKVIKIDKKVIYHLLKKLISI